MNEQTPSDDLRPLRDADPAMSAHASDALRARVVGIPASGQAHARRRWLVPVAAAAAVVAVVGGAFAWGSGALAPSPGVTPLAVATGSPETPAPPIALGSAGGGALELQADTMASPFFTAQGAHRFVVPPLDAATSTASTWAFEGASRYSAEEASRIAAALGVSGEPSTADMGGWMIGDPASAHLFLTPWRLSYEEGTPHPVKICEQQGDEQYGRDKLNDDGSWAFGQHMIQCMAEMPSPSEDDAQAAMKRFLTAVGIDPAHTQITIMDMGDDTTIMSVIAALVVDGDVTDITANIQVTAQGILSASAPVGTVVSLGEYPIVSPADAALRLNDTAYAASTVRSPGIADGIAALPPDVPAPAPTPGAAIPWSIGVHEITSARLGLASVIGPDRAHYLVPAYEFTASDGTVWSVIALADEALAESPLG